MTKEQAQNIIEQALNVAQAKGAFSLQDSRTVLTALETMFGVKEAPTQKETKEEEKETKEE